MKQVVNSPVPYSLVGSGLVKTADIGGGRFGAWSYKAFAPTSYVQTTQLTPIGQLSVPPTYANLSSYGMTASPAKTQAINARPWSPKSPTFWLVLVVLVILATYVKRHRHL